MKPNRFWRIVLPVGIVLCTAFIWSRSLQSAAASTEDSNHLAGVFAGWFGWEADAFWLTYLVRKAAHFAEFALLGALWGGCGRVYPWRWIALWGLPTGVIDECLQFFAPGRAPMVADVLIDVAGYLCGLAILWIFVYLRRKKIK